MDSSNQGHRSSIYERLREHLLAHAVWAALGLAVGILLLSFTTFNNAVYMKEGESIGPMFHVQLVLVKVESNRPMCTFGAGLDDPPLGIQRGEMARVGDYEINLLQCDSDRKFAVLHLRRTTEFYRATSALWHLLHLQ